MAEKDDAVAKLKSLAGNCSIASGRGTIPARNARLGRAGVGLDLWDKIAVETPVTVAIASSSDVNAKAYAALTAVANYFNTLYVPSQGSTEPGTGTEAQAIVAVRDFMAAFAAAALSGSVPALATRHGRGSDALVALDVAALQAASNTSVSGSSAGNYGASDFVQALKAYADTVYQHQGGA